MKYPIDYTLLIIILLATLNFGCGQSDQESSYKEILETTYEKRLKKTAELAQYEKKQDRRLIYRKDQLQKEQISIYRRKKTIESQYTYEYNNQGKLISKKYFYEETETPKMHQVFSYDTNGNWKSIERINEKGKSEQIIQVNTRTDSMILASADGLPRSMQIRVSNSGKDSIVNLKASTNGNIKPRISTFKKNDRGDIVYELSYNTEGDSLLLERNFQYNYINDGDDWDYSIINIRAINWQNREMIIKDSIVRELMMNTKPTKLNKANLVGNWKMHLSKPSSIKLSNNSTFEMYQNGKLNTAGTWKLNNNKKELTLMFEKGDAKGTVEQMEIIDIYENQMNVKFEDAIRKFTRQ